MPGRVRRAGARDPAGGRRGADPRSAPRPGVHLAAGDASAGAGCGGSRPRARHPAARLELLLQVPRGGARRALRGVAPGRDVLGPRAAPRDHRVDRDRRRRRRERLHERDPRLPPPGDPRARQVGPGGQPPQHQPGGAGRAGRRGAGGLHAAPGGADVAPRRDAPPREPPEPLDAPPVRPGRALHDARRPAGGAELAPRLLPAGPRPRRRPLPATSRPSRCPGARDGRAPIAMRRRAGPRIRPRVARARWRRRCWASVPADGAPAGAPQRVEARFDLDAGKSRARSPPTGSRFPTAPSEPASGSRGRPRAARSAGPPATTSSSSASWTASTSSPVSRSASPARSTSGA